SAGQDGFGSSFAVRSIQSFEFPRRQSPPPVPRSSPHFRGHAVGVPQSSLVWLGPTLISPLPPLQNGRMRTDCGESLWTSLFRGRGCVIIDN
uniref:Ovule protein n=1 Tax=Globodera pallida TaxID=36090 RepID=A0A183CRK9_GLOPA